MKTILISAGVLILVLLMSLANSVYVSARCQAWERQLSGVEDAAANGQWEASHTQLEALHRSWNKAEPYLHVVTHHEEIEQARILLEQCRLFVELKDSDALLTAGEQLRCQYRHLAQTEELHFENIL